MSFKLQSLVHALLSVGILATILPGSTLAVDDPATPEAAAKVLDLRTWDVPKDVLNVSMKSLGNLMYETTGKPKPVFEQVRGVLTKSGWKELPGGYYSDDTNTCTLAKQGYHLSLTTSTGYTKPGESVNVTIINQGNVVPKSLPVPKTFTSLGYPGLDVSYKTAAEPQAAVQEVGKLLVAAGWTPYGSASQVPEQPMEYFKKNAIRVMVWGSKAPALENQTMVRLSTELLTFDVPMFEGSEHSDYKDTPPVLTFSIKPDELTAMYEFYTAEFTKAGWKATTENPVFDEKEREGFLIFRNAAEDMVSIDTIRFNDKADVSIKFNTKAEVEEMDKAAEVAAREAKEKMEEENRRTTVEIPAPTGASELDVISEQTIEYTLPPGKAQAGYNALVKHLTGEGWKEDKSKRSTTDKITGQTELAKDSETIEIQWTDPGILESSLRISGSSKLILNGAEPGKNKGAKKEEADKKPAQKGNKKNPLIPDLPPGVELPKEATDLLNELNEGKSGDKDE